MLQPWFQDASKTLQMPPNFFKMPPRWPKIAPRCFQVASQRAQDIPKTLQDASKIAQDGSKMAQDSPKTAQRESNILQDTPKMPPRCPKVPQDAHYDRLFCFPFSSAQVTESSLQLIGVAVVGRQHSLEGGAGGRLLRGAPGCTR